MDASAAFRKLVEMAERRLEGKVHRVDEAMACAIGAEFIREMSGSWAPEDMIWNDEPKHSERLDKLKKRLQIE